MALDLILGQTDTVSEHERKDRNNQTVEKEISEKTDTDGTDDEKGTGTPFQTNWFGIGHGFD